jgi:hypothetical protein
MVNRKPIRTLTATELVEAIIICIKNGHNAKMVLRTRYAKWIVVCRHKLFAEFHPILVKMRDMEFVEISREQLILLESIRLLIRRATVRSSAIVSVEPLTLDSKSYKQTLGTLVDFCSRFVH